MTRCVSPRSWWSQPLPWTRVYILFSREALGPLLHHSILPRKQSLSTRLNISSLSSVRIPRTSSSSMLLLLTSSSSSLTPPSFRLVSSFFLTPLLHHLPRLHVYTRILVNDLVPLVHLQFLLRHLPLLTVSHFWISSQSQTLFSRL